MENIETPKDRFQKQFNATVKLKELREGLEEINKKLETDILTEIIDALEEIQTLLRKGGVHSPK